MTNNALQELLSKCPGPFHYVPSSCGVDDTFEVRCESTDTRVVASPYWDDGGAAEVIAQTVSLALEVARDGATIQRDYKDLPLATQFLFARYPGPYHCEFLNDKHDPTYAVVCRTTEDLVIGESADEDCHEARLIVTAVADALNVLLSTVREPGSPSTLIQA